jgi:hypothetical protein
VEYNKPSEAGRYLKVAADSMPAMARVQYSLGLLLQSFKKDSADLYMIYRVYTPTCLRWFFVLKRKEDQ